MRIGIDLARLAVSLGNRWSFFGFVERFTIDRFHLRAN